MRTCANPYAPPFALPPPAQVKFDAFNGHGLATLAWALCSLDVRPRRLWLEDYVLRAGAKMVGVWGPPNLAGRTLPHPTPAPLAARVRTMNQLLPRPRCVVCRT